METDTQRAPNGRSTSESTVRRPARRPRERHGPQPGRRTRARSRICAGPLDIEGRVKRNPYGTSRPALGIGYLLGGGLFTPLTGRLVGLGLRIGLRLAVLPVVRDELAELAEALDGGRSRLA